jgi:sterol desaturase/sphingolipid hydroxylase (fatty acid hydroxylase superfamily)
MRVIPTIQSALPSRHNKVIQISYGFWIALILAGLFVLLAIIETVRPRRKLALGRHPRWRTHAVFFICNTALGRALGLLIAVGSAALWAQEAGFGLFHLTSWPWWAEVLAAFVLLDFAIWLQHVVMHRLPILWQMHKVHHSDRDLDVSSALRFHPLEIAVSAVYKSAWVVMLGVPVPVAVAFELWLNANALFNHSNIRLPPAMDRILRTFLVTPDFHFVHHSVVPGEQQHNFGFALNIWDRMAGCYLPEAAAGRDAQIVGLEEAQNSDPGRAIWSLLLPFKR